ncbi:hypothetical protein evm_006744 [Chilo suppressalis]|nr:hypothetical protein evm_006744 [Chilo suppressalis]
MPSCVIKWCKNNSCSQKKHCGITFHKFPTATMWKETWIKAIRNSRNEEHWLPSKYSVVCSLHFEECDVYYTKCGLRRIKKNAIPKKVVNPTTCEEMKEYDHGLEKSTPDFNVQQFSQYYDSEKGLNANNLYGHTLVEQTEDISMPRDHDSTSEVEIRDSELESIFDTPRKNKLRKEVRRYKMRLQIQVRKIKTLNQRVRRLRKRNATLKNILKDLKKKNYIDADVFDMLDENIVAADLFNNIKKKLGKKRIKYSAAFKRFCLTLNFYSPKAYDYVRKTFHTCLPHHKTLCKWYAHIKGEPGFTEEAFIAVKQKAEASEYRPICALIFDEMALRQQKIWDGKRYQGLVDMGTGATSDSAALASQAFVFLLVAINQRWKIPLGYFLTNNLTGEQKANLTKMCLSKCFDVGVDVVSLTFDGHATNLTTMELLKCNIKDLKSMKTTFKHPCNDTEVVCFLDPCHVMKLIRNQLQCKKEFLDTNGQVIKWDYLVELNALQDSEGLHLANKLSKRHGIYRKLLTHLELKCLTTGNCIPLENIHILNCTSATEIINSTSVSYRHEEENVNPSLNFLQSIDDTIENLAAYLDVPDINNFRKYVIGYIAGGVSHYLTRKIKCEPCVSRLLSSERHEFHKLITLRDKGGLSFPSLDTYDICCTCELVIRKIVKVGIVITSEIQHKYILSQILKRFVGNRNIFINLQNEHNMYGIEHQTNLIRAVIEKFINIRFHHIAKQETVLRSCDTKRQYYKKLTQHKGQ